MSIALLKKLDSKYALGLLLAILAFAIAIYTDFLRTRNPALVIDVISNYKILDLKESLNKIDISYAGESILRDSQTLSLVLLQIGNEGNEDILQNYYDDSSPVSISIDNGKILERPILVQASNEYLKTKLLNIKDSLDKILLPEIILESGEYFIFKLLIKHKQQEAIQISSSGKVAGVKTIKIKTSYLSGVERSFWDSIVEGSPLVHFCRLIIYLAVIIIISITIGFLLSMISGYFEKISRTREIKKFKLLFRDQELINKYDWAFDEYLASGKHVLNYWIKLKDPNFLKQNTSLTEGQPEEMSLEKLSIYREQNIYSDIATSELLFILDKYSKLKILTDRHVIRTEEGQPQINIDFIELLEAFIKYIK